MGDMTLLKQANKEYTDMVNVCKDFAAARRKSRKYSVEMVSNWLEGIERYVEDQRTNNKPLTVAGFCLKALGGLPTSTYYELKDGSKDYILEEYLIVNNIDIDTLDVVDGIPTYIDSNGQIVKLMPFSELIKYVDLLIQEDREERCLMSSKHNPAGSIFLLKSQHGFKEDSEPKELHQNLIIADGNRAKDIIKLLNG